MSVLASRHLSKLGAQRFADAGELVAARGIGNVHVRYKEPVEVAPDGLVELGLELADRRQLRFH